MKLELTAAQKEKLLGYLNSDPDSEALSATEYVADFYDVDAPAPINVLLTPKGDVEVAAAARLLYDEAEDGWYMGDRMEDAAAVLALLSAAGAV